jgi:uncharacterized OsmC-like protein
MTPTIRDAVDTVRQRVGDDPARAVVKVRAEGRMGEGTRVDMRIGAFEVGVDEPVSVGGTGTAPNPVQLSLAALGSCQAITYRYWATELGLRLDAVSVSLEANFDTGAFFGFPGAAGPVSPASVHCAVTLEGPEPPERYKELVTVVDEHCPILDLFTRSIPVERNVTFG